MKIYKLTTLIFLISTLALGYLLWKSPNKSGTKVISLPGRVEKGGGLSGNLDETKEKVKKYLTNSLNIPSTVNINIGEIKPSEVPGLNKGDLEFVRGQNTQKGEFYLSNDGNYLILGKLMNLSVDPTKDILQKISIDNEPLLGNKGSKVTIVEYSDFQCPFCSRAHKTMEENVMKEYGDKVQWVFKNFPLTNIHKWAESASVASECAFEQGNEFFWKLATYLFDNQKSINETNLKEKVMEFAKGAKMDKGKFEKCFDEQKTLNEVKADMDEAQAIEVRSTPTFFINGRQLAGARPYEDFKAMIDEELKK